ncbi:MAG: DUF4038 domain-containing protein [Thermoguttaceae bacterium]|jgi:hypothetical protein|nr:DUF4038 domain-containing protein [Thermoguttaceae bacterium]
MTRTTNTAVWLAVAAACLPAWASDPDKVHPWTVFEIELTAQRDLAEPYREGLPDAGPGHVKVVFRGESGEAQGRQIAIHGFWDGGRTWRARFAPPASGTWSYRSSSGDPGLDGKTGRFECVAWTAAEKEANPTRRGLVRVCRTGPRPGRYFEYADGTPMLWLGDTWWNWTKRGIPFERFQKLVDDRAAKGFNVGQLFFAGNGWGRESSLLDATFAKPDLERIRHVERMIEYANSKGITVWIHAWWTRADMGKRIGEENLRRWWRYVVHRLGAYHVIWVLAGEYNMYDYGGLGLAFWKDLGRLIDAEDPYERLLGAHPTPPGWQGGAAAPQWSTAEVVHDEPWLNYHQSQTGHGRWRNELIPTIVEAAYRKQPAKPIVVTEPWYEFIAGNPTAADIRFGAWSAVLSGAAGHSYGGGHVWRAHVPEAPASRGAWPMEMDFRTDTLDYPGAKAVSFMAKFLRQIAWWQLEPHPELVLENPSHYCAAVPGREYVAYLRWGGVAKLDLRPSSAQTPFEYRWIDLTEEKVKRTGTTGGGEIREFRPPEDYPGVEQSKDWILHVVRK